MKKCLPMYGPVLRVTVKQDNNYYLCQCMPGNRWKCGKCGFGLVYPFGSKAYQNHKCKRCGAELAGTVYGYHWQTAMVYNP